MSSRAKTVIRSRMTVTAEGPAVERENLLRVHHGELIIELYTDITNSIYRRALQHKRGEIEGFTERYNINRLVYYEIFHQVGTTIAREKQIKSWTHAKRLALIATKNPDVARPRRGLGRKVRTADPSARRMILQSSGLLGMT